MIGGDAVPILEGMHRWSCAALLLVPSSALANPVEDLPAGHWREISLNTIEDVDPCPERDCSYSAVEGLYGAINDWCGGVLASGFGTLGGLVVYGGGHNGYFGSELYVFDIETQLWERYTEPYDNGGGSVAPDCNGDGVYPDGSPCPPHTYDRVEYSPSTNAFVLLFSTTDPVCGGCDSPNAHHFGFDNDAWTLGGTHPEPPSGTGAASAYDPNRDKLWLLPPYNGQLSSYDLQTNTWETHGAYNISIDIVGAIDPGRDLFVVVEGRETNTVVVFDLVQGTSDGVTVNVDGSSPVMDSGANGFEWDPVSEQFVGWAGGTEVWTLVPPDGDWRTENWEWLRVDAADDNTVSPTEPNSNGTYSRWRYVPSVNAFVLINRIEDPVYAYRLSDEPGVGPNPPGGTGTGGDETGADGSGDADAGGDATASAGDDDSAGGTDASGPGSTTDPTAGTGGSEASTDDNADDGCGCRSTTPPPRLLLLGLVALTSWRRRSRRTGGSRARGASARL